MTLSTWVLILTFGSGNGIESAVVPGFATQAECLDAITDVKAVHTIHKPRGVDKLDTAIAASCSQQTQTVPAQ
jgi:hypothetical protein